MTQYTPRVSKGTATRRRRPDDLHPVLPRLPVPGFHLVADEDSRKAVIVDPRRDVEEYLADARELGLTIVGVINTHFHADFLSGHPSWPRPPAPGSATA